MISIKDYAKDNGVTYEAVRRQVKRYENELEGHVHRQGRTQFLDDVAVAILDTHRSQSPVVVYDKGRDERIQELEAIVADLSSQLDLCKTKLINAQERLLISEGAQARLTAAEKENVLLEGFLKDAKTEIRTLIEEKSQEVAQARQEASETARMVADEEWGRRLTEAQEQAKDELSEGMRQVEMKYQSMGIFEFIKHKIKGNEK